MPAPKGNTYPATGKVIRDALRNAVHKSPKALAKMADTVVQKASEGDLAFITYLSDRLDGKPIQEQIIEQVERGTISAEPMSAEDWHDKHAPGVEPATGTTTRTH